MMRSKHAKSDSEKGDTKSMPIGLASNPQGREFRCGTCEWFHEGKCENLNPRLTGKTVDPYWCCNLYDNDEMQIILR